MTSRLQELCSLGKELGYEGEQLRAFIQEERERDEKVEKILQDQKDWEREERRLQREDEKMKRELEEKKLALEEAQKKMDHAEKLRALDIEARKVELQQEPRTSSSQNNAPQVKLKLPCFDQGKDDMDAFITRFEMYCATQAIPKEKWNLHLSTLLKGEALNVYWRQPIDDIDDYDKLKNALLKRFKLTADGYRNKFRSTKSEDGESTFQYLSRLKSYVDRWVQMSELDPTYGNLTDLIVCEQFLKICNRDLSTFLLELSPGGLDLIATAAEQYMLAHNLQHACDYKKTRTNFPQRPQQLQNSSSEKHFNRGNTQESKQTKVSDSGQSQKGNTKCFVCGKTNHIAKNCFYNVYNKPNVNYIKSKEFSSNLNPSDKKPNDFSKPKENATVVQESTKSESKVVLSLMCSDPFNEVKEKGILNGHEVDVLRDSGSSEVVVAKKFVLDSQFTGVEKEVIFLDNSRCKVTEALVDLDCPYFKGNVKASVMANPLFDVVVGNVPGAIKVNEISKKSEAVEIRSNISQVNVQTRSMHNERKKLPKPLNVVPSVLDISKSRMLDLQRNDSTLAKVIEQAVVYNEEGSIPVKSFVIKDNLLYRISPSKQLQLVIPKDLRGDVMKIAHEGLLAGHMGIANTFNKVSSQFFWPGYSQDIEDYVKSCHQCQVTCYKGRVGKAPLGKTPLIATPFSRIALDLIGPLYPPSEDGHRYILSVVDYATRYPEAVALKSIDSVTVAEALIDIYSRVGVPDEILTDQGTQFVSGVMKEVSRLLSIKQLRTTPYHPQCNGLVERFNGTLKSMLRKMTQEKPKSWHRYLPALLFAVRETPQSSTGFSPFELIYGRTVKGPMYILREIWTEEQRVPETWKEYDYVFNLRNKLEDTCKLAQESLDLSQRRYKRYFDQHSRFRTLKPKDKVLVLLPVDSSKLTLKWKGPYEVIAAKGNNDYLVKFDGTSKIFHINMLKKYCQREQGSENVRSSNVVAIAVVNDEDDSLFPHRAVEPLETVANVKIDPNLDKVKKEQLESILLSHSSTFTDIPKETNQIFHDIDLTTCTPVRSRPYAAVHGKKKS